MDNLIVRHLRMPNCEIATCKFYNADGPFILERLHHYPITALGIMSVVTIAFK